MTKPRFAQWLKSQRFAPDNYVEVTRHLADNPCCMNASADAESFSKHFATHTPADALSKQLNEAWQQYDEKSEAEILLAIEESRLQSTGQLMQRFANAMQEPAKLAFIEGYRVGSRADASNDVIWELVKDDFQKWWQTIGGGAS